MSNTQIFGIDCGASKVMAQSALYNSKSNIISPGKINFEYKYSSYPEWDPNFIPVPIEIQKKELNKGVLNIQKNEKYQSQVILRTIKKVISKIQSDSIGFCYPGIKNNSGIVLMNNGPRIPNLLNKIQKISSIYNDSECCLYGEINSTIGKIQKTNNAIYIGGGTGIADGIILNGNIIDFNKNHDIKRSWELLLPSNKTIESCLSPNGILREWNKINSKKDHSLFDIMKNPNAKHLFIIASNAFSHLIKNRSLFFKNNNYKIEKIVIGQRLGEFLKICKSDIKTMFESKTKIPIEYSHDRRTAALGAAWKKICS